MPEPISDDESLRRLRDFLCQLEALLGELSLEEEHLIPGRHHEAMHAAWKSVQPQFAVLTNELRPPASIANVPKLKALGLTGDQLVFKLSIYQHAHDELIDHIAPIRIAKNKQERGWRVSDWFRRKWRQLLECTFASADVLVDSLGIIFPNAAHAIKEFKEATEAGLKLGEVLSGAEKTATPDKVT